MVFFLDVPFEFSQKLIKERNNKITGEEKKDIHESDKEYLKNAYDLSKEPAKEYNWVIISCVKDDKLKSIEEINNEIMERIEDKEKDKLVLSVLKSKWNKKFNDEILIKER